MFSPYSLDITGFSDFCHRPQEVNEDKPTSASFVPTNEANEADAKESLIWLTKM